MAVHLGHLPKLGIEGFSDGSEAVVLLTVLLSGVL